VFGALEHQAWDALINGYEVVVPRIVLDEVQFYVSRETGRRVEVDTHTWIEAGLVECYEASATELAETIRLINQPGGPEIHEGEAEALTYLRLGMDPAGTDVAFVSADGAAIQGTALLDLSHKARCLADILEAVGYTKPLAARYRREFLERHVREGFGRRLRRGG
jgi:hypothetical protein